MKQAIKQATQLTKNKKIIFMIVAAVLLLLVAFIVYRLIDTRNVYAVVGDEVIYVDELERATEGYENYLNKRMPNADIDAREYALDQLVLYKALSQEGDRLGRGYSDSDIDDMLAVTALHIVPADFALTSIDMPKDERTQIARDFLSEDVGWDDELTSRYHAIRILKNQLEGNIIEEYGLLRVWTNPVEENGEDSIQLNTLERQTLSRLEEGQSAAEIKQFIDSAQLQTSSDADHYLYSDFMSRISLGDLRQRLGENITTVFESLEEEGDYTQEPILFSNDTYNVFRLEGRFGGEHATWEDYIAAERDSARVFSSPLDIRRIVGAP